MASKNVNEKIKTQTSSPPFVWGIYERKYSPVSINQPRSFNFQALKILMVGLNRSGRLIIFEKTFLWSLNRYGRFIICPKIAKSM